MRFLQDVSIQRKLMRIIMLTSSVSLLLASGSYFLYELVTFQGAATQELMSIADIIAANSTAALEFNDPEAGEEILASLNAQEQIIAACIYNEEGNLFTAYRQGGRADDFAPPGLREEGSYLEGGRLIVFRPIVLHGEKIGTISLDSDLRLFYARLKGVSVIVAIALAAASLVAFLLSSRLQRLISKPVLHLAETASLVSTQKNYSLRAVSQSRDELGLLVDRFNEMLDQIQQRDAALQKAHDDLEIRVQERTAELKRAQEKLIASERLAVLGQFAGSVAHEIRNPLHVIGGSAYYLSRKMKGCDEKIRTHIDQIKSQVGYSGEIIENILNLTRMKAPIPVKIDLSEVVRAEMDIAEVPAAVTVVLNLSNGPVQVLADKSQILLAFKNIITNALQSMPEGGTLDVGLERVRKEEKAWAEVSFSDDGPGIEPENIEKIFQPLFTTKSTGIGFGLTIVKLIVEKHNGLIFVESKAGKGATFIIRLPMA